MDAAEKVAVLERTKVIRWRSQNGLADDADFAYYFDTAEQAFAEAGYAIQNEWVRVRQQVAGSASNAVLDLVLQEIRAENAAPKSKSRPAPAAAKVATRRMGRLYPPRGTAWLKRGGSLRVPRPPQRVKPEPVDLADANAPNLAALIGCVLDASAIRPAGPAAQEDAVRPVMENLVQGTEVATVSRAVNTWRELQAWCVFWVMAFGVVRWAHTRRSRLLSVNQHSMLFMCSHGKHNRQRHGFLWSVPRFAATTQTPGRIYFLEPPLGVGSTFDEGVPVRHGGSTFVHRGPCCHTRQ